MVNSVYLTLSCRESRLCLYIYFLKFLFIYLFCMLFASTPPDLQTRCPPECPALVDLPSAVPGCPRAFCAPRGRECPCGIWRGTCTGPQHVGAPGAPNPGRWESCGGQAAQLPGRAVFFNSPTTSHWRPPPPGKIPSRSTKLQPRSSSRASSLSLSLPARSTGQQAPLPVEQVPHTYDHKVHPTEDRNSFSVTGFPWILPSKPWLKFTVCKSEDTILLSLACQVCCPILLQL